MSLAARTGVSTTSADYRALRLFVVTPGEGTATIVTKAPLAASDLGQTADARDHRERRARASSPAA